MRAQRKVHTEICVWDESTRVGIRISKKNIRNKK